MVNYYQTHQPAISSIFKAMVSLSLLFLESVFPELEEVTLLKLTPCNPIKKDKKEFVLKKKMKAKLTNTKHIYFTSFSARMYIRCGTDKLFSNCDLRAIGGPICPRWSCG